MKCTKKILALLLITILVLLSCTGCFMDKKESTFEDELTAELNLIFEDLLEKIPDTSDINAQKQYLIKWANSHNVPVSYDKYNNIIMSKKATEGYEDVENTIFHCSIGNGDPFKKYQAMATALYLIDKTEKHGFIRVLFTDAQNNTYVGAENISTNYLKGKNLINLTWAEKTSFTIGCAGKAEYDFSKQLEWIKPTYPNAYEFSIKGLNGGSSGVISGSHPNPIKIIGDFLASAKSKGLLIELASFNGGESSVTYPTGATAVVLINDNDVHKFEKWFQNEANKFEGKYEDVEESYTFTLKPVEVPEFVISRDDSTKVFSLLYTMINGVYLKSDEGKTIATSNIGTISTTTGNLDVTICARSLKESTLQEISSTFEIICGLNDVSYKATSTSPLWNANEDSDLLLRLTDIFLNSYDKKIKHKSSIASSECAIFNLRNSNLDILSMSLNFENGIAEIEALKEYLETSNQPWEPNSQET